MPDPADLLRAGADTYAAKNEDYGDSWRLTGELLWRMAGEEPIVLDSPEACISFGLYTRRLDKIIRCVNGEFRADDLHFEGVAEDHGDEKVYASMHESLVIGDNAVTGDEGGLRGD